MKIFVNPLFTYCCVVVTLALIGVGCSELNAMKGGKDLLGAHKWVTHDAGQFCETRVPKYHPSKFAYVYAAHNDDYVLGALISAISLKNHTKKKYDIVVLITERISSKYLRYLDEEGVKYFIVSHEKLPRSKLARYSDSMIKICAFNYEQYSKIVFIDSDTLIYGDLDYLFDHEINENEIVGTTDAFNRLRDLHTKLITTAFYLLKPSEKIFKEMVDFNLRNPQDADMDLVNNFFEQKKKIIINLPFYLNWQFDWIGIPVDFFPDMRVLHFNNPKPWDQLAKNISVSESNRRFYDDWRRIYFATIK